MHRVAKANRRRMQSSGCLVIILASALLIVSGCGWVANPRSKLASEAKKQTLILERIAVALESDGCFVDRGGVCRERGVRRDAN